jgi:hypothetical protein
MKNAGDVQSRVNPVCSELIKMDVTIPRLHLSVVQKYKIYVCDTKLTEISDNLIHSHACAFSN